LEDKVSERASVSKTLRFVPIQEDHIPAILKIEHEANSAPWSERSFRNELDHPHGIFLVALVDGRVVGYGGVWLVIDEAHITTVAVAEEHRRQGIGWRIMVELLEKAKERGMACSTLEVRAGNPGAIELYRRLGYEVSATRKGYYPDNREDAVVMWMHDLQTWEPPRR
jgi:ribosomal-protein-alanine N-acetyltransferase